MLDPFLASYTDLIALCLLAVIKLGVSSLKLQCPGHTSPGSWPVTQARPRERGSLWGEHDPL